MRSSLFTDRYESLYKEAGEFIIPKNEGFFEQIKLVVPKGCLLNPEPGKPVSAHWGVPDPADAKGTPAEVALAFKETYRLLFQRISVFTALPLRSLNGLTLQGKLRDIGSMEGSTAKVTEAK